jgi:hypothetical protein
MKNTMLRSLSLLGIGLMLSLSVAAQKEPKVKTSEDETKYKSENLKTKQKKDENKYKSADIKVKEKKDETKYKGDDMKMKDEDDKRKLKARVEPMERTRREHTVIKTGEPDVMTKQHIERVVIPPPEPAPVVAAPIAPPKVEAPVKKATPRKYAARKAAPKRNTGQKVVYRTKVVRDTVFVPTPPERVVSVEKEFIHDTVSITRVDTVFRMATENTYTGYSVPRGDFKKVKLKTDDDGEVWMKRKEKDGKVKSEKVKREY